MEEPRADESAPSLLGVVLAGARRRPLRRVGLPEREVLHAVDRVDRECARIERQHEGAEHALVLVGVRFTSDVKVLDDRRILDVVLPRRRERILTTLDGLACVDINFK